MLQSEEDFIEQYARVLLTQWCLTTLDAGSIINVSHAGGYHVSQKVTDLCVAFAEKKGWISKSEPRKVLAKGYATAAAFLKR